MTIKTPEPGSAQWKANEKIINSEPSLKQARDVSQGLDKPGKRYSAGGKGSTYRPVNKEKFDANWDQIFGKKDKTQ